MSEPLIDVHAIETFQPSLLMELETETALIEDFLLTSQRQQYERMASDHRGIPPSNPRWQEFDAFNEHLAGILIGQSIRAWHYTRLTDRELTAIKRFGFVPSTAETLKERLKQAVIAGDLDQDMAGRIFDLSPIHDEREGVRSNMFWATTQPAPIYCGGVRELLEYWGGEVVSFLTEEVPIISAKLRQIGKPRVFEIAMPLEGGYKSRGIASAIITTFAKHKGIPECAQAYDIFTTRPLGPEAIRSVLSAGDDAFYRLGA